MPGEKKHINSSIHLICLVSNYSNSRIYYLYYMTLTFLVLLLFVKLRFVNFYINQVNKRIWWWRLLATMNLSYTDYTRRVKSANATAHYQYKHRNKCDLRHLQSCFCQLAVSYFSP